MIVTVVGTLWNSLQPETNARKIEKVMVFDSMIVLANSRVKLLLHVSKRRSGFTCDEKRARRFLVEHFVFQVAPRLGARSLLRKFQVSTISGKNGRENAVYRPVYRYAALAFGTVLTPYRAALGFFQHTV